MPILQFLHLENMSKTFERFGASTVSINGCVQNSTSLYKYKWPTVTETLHRDSHRQTHRHTQRHTLRHTETQRHEIHKHTHTPTAHIYLKLNIIYYIVEYTHYIIIILLHDYVRAFAECIRMCQISPC